MHEEESTRSEQAQAGPSSRRHFLGNLAIQATAASLLGAGTPPMAADKPEAGTKPLGRKIKLGWIGGGGRGSWLAGLFKKHGGFEIHAVADYFPDLVDRCGEALGVDRSRRFSGLSGCKKVLETGVEALGVLDVPCFFPEQARAALAAGCHVYMAKPIAVDVPGCLAIAAAGKLATQKKLCFLIDYQMPTDPINIEVAQRIWDGGLGELLAVTTLGAGEAPVCVPTRPKARPSKAACANCAGATISHSAETRSSITTSMSSIRLSGSFAGARSARWDTPESAGRIPKVTVRIWLLSLTSAPRVCCGTIRP